VLLTALLAVAALPARAQSSSAEQPNIVVIFTDDLGYGDIGPFGHPTIRTPHLDRMASKGMKLTQFYIADPVCTPSRAALMTGRLPVRSGLTRVLFPDDSTGLPAREVTLAEALSDQGYATAAVGKWHLGHLPQYLPTAHGFDSYFGVPYSNDMYADPDAAWERKRHFPDVPLMRDTTVVERPVRQATLTRRYTEEATQFIRENRGEQPFFLYLAHTFPHVPLHASERFRGESRRGRYGDVVEELDWSVGRVLQTLRERDLAENTLVVFTSDNGPWLTKGLRGGSPGLLRNGKGTTWEGGMRVPTIAWWPSEIEGGTVSAALGTTMDLYTTALRLAGATPPQDRPVDGMDLTPVLRGASDSVREEVPYYLGDQLFAVRRGPWKVHFKTISGFNGEITAHDPSLLFHLGHDPAEQHDVAAEHPGVVEELRRVAERHRASGASAQRR
jgi:arylsulfatase A-like enzyme